MYCKQKKYALRGIFLFTFKGGFNAVNQADSKFDGAFRTLVKNDAVRVVTSRILSSGMGEFIDEYFAQMLTPVMENIAFDGEKFTFKNNPVKPLSKENLYAGLLGGFAGGLPGGGEGKTHLNSAVDLDARMFEAVLGITNKKKTSKKQAILRLPTEIKTIIIIQVRGEVSKWS